MASSTSPLSTDPTASSPATLSSSSVAVVGPAVTPEPNALTPSASLSSLLGLDLSSSSFTYFSLTANSSTPTTSRSFNSSTESSSSVESTSTSALSSETSSSEILTSSTSLVSSTLHPSSSTASGTSLSATSTSTTTPQPLSTGAKAGVAIAVIVFLAIIGSIAGFFVLKKRRRRHSREGRIGGSKRASLKLGSGKDGTTIEWMGMASGAGKEGGVLGSRGYGRDELGRVGRYEDAEAGLPLPRTDGDRHTGYNRGRNGGGVRGSIGGFVEAWRGKGGLGR